MKNTLVRPEGLFEMAFEVKGSQVGEVSVERKISFREIENTESEKGNGDKKESKGHGSRDVPGSGELRQAATR